jgi:hypothetical protein
MSVLIFIVCFLLSFWLTNEIRHWFATRPTRCDKGLPCGCMKTRNGYCIIARCEDKEPIE